MRVCACVCVCVCASFPHVIAIDIEHITQRLGWVEAKVSDSHDGAQVRLSSTRIPDPSPKHQFS